MSEVTAHPADRVAAWATGIGIGMLVFMLTWLVGNRLTALVLEPPAAPILAMAFAVVAGSLVAVTQGRRLATRFNVED